ncbi:MAG: class I SAM-dependent methyltransferase [Spirochaetales bacterium]|nr:class I SAM-dependent methyltransferase [Spirochaetales bacterium]
MNEIDVYRCLSEFRLSLMRSIIESLGISPGGRGLDAGCGIGTITRLLSEYAGKNGSVTGLDFSEDFIGYAKKTNSIGPLEFIVGDVNSLPFENGFFDWVWSADTLWPGPKEHGCPSENPVDMVKEVYRVIKPGGSAFILFWSSQKLLPGYPILEARLNTASRATAPFVRGMDPMLHVMNGIHWLRKAGFHEVSVKTYPGDIGAPLRDNDKKALSILLPMFWGEAESEMEKEDWKVYKTLTDPDSEAYILRHDFYYGFYTYTLFRGVK